MASTLIAVRVPDNLVALIDAKGKRSSVIVEALELLFAEAPPAPVVKRDVESGHAACDPEYSRPKPVKRPMITHKPIVDIPRPHGVVGQKCPHGWMNAYVCQDGCNK